jgi:dipeptidyl-peptidase-4
MDKPDENPEGYAYGSVMNYADNLKGTLRLTAGTMDDNVHYQNTLQLVDKFENLGKHFELMVYPNERHGYRSIKWFHASKENLDFWKTNFNLSE